MKTAISKGLNKLTKDAMKAAQAAPAVVETQHDGAETPEEKVARLKRELAEAKTEAKVVKKTASVQCAHKDSKTEVQCRLFACEGGCGFCSNHRPLNDDEYAYMDIVLDQLDVDGLILLMGEQQVKAAYRQYKASQPKAEATPAAAEGK